MFEHRSVVLFLCTGNSCRSQMAEGFLRHYAEDRFEPHSAGIDPAPTVHPMAVRVMGEVGIDISGQKPKGIKTYLGKLPVSTIVTVCDSAAKNCPTVWPGVRQRLHWSLDDPAAFVGDEADTLQEFRKVRDQIDSYIKEWIR